MIKGQFFQVGAEEVDPPLREHRVRGPAMISEVALLQVRVELERHGSRSAQRRCGHCSTHVIARDDARDSDVRKPRGQQVRLRDTPVT